MHLNRLRRGRTLVAIAAIASLVLSACGDDDDDSATTTGAATTAAGGTGTTAAAGGDAVAQAQAALAEVQGDVTLSAPAGSPAAPAGKKVFIISVDQQLEGIAREANGVQAAAELAGWESTLVDGKSTPDAWTAGIERAVNEKADGIFLLALDVSFVKAAADAAIAAKIPIVSITSGSQVGPTGVAAEIGSVEYNTEMGRLEGRFAVADSQGSAQALVFNDTSFTTAPPIADGAVEVLGGCSGCKVLEKIDFTGAEIVTKFSETVRTAITRHPETNYVIVPYDFAAIYAAQGIRDAGGAGKIKLLSTGGNLANLDLIRKGDVQVMTSAQPLEYFGYLAVDAMIRVFSGQEAAPFEAPQKALVQSNLPPAGQPWTGDNDFAAEFKTAWGK
jgi:ribose transport system substrate-binding protein